jgi:hypothetical protein
LSLASLRHAVRLACFAAASPAAANAAADCFAAAGAGVEGVGVEGAAVEGVGVEGVGVEGVGVEGVGVEGAGVAGGSPICPGAAKIPPATGNSPRQTAAATVEKRIYHPRRKPPAGAQGSE